MSDSEEVDDIVVLWWWLKNRKKKNRRYWIHPLLVDKNNSAYIVAKELSGDPKIFQSFYRMSILTFHNLLEKLVPLITKIDTKFREAIKPEEKLIITLRYLATGDSFRSLGHYFKRGHKTVGLITDEVTEAIWKALQSKYLPVPDVNLWKTISTRFEQLWSLPHCLGAIDGKHIRIKKFNNQGSKYFNYKGFHSIQLLACVDADGCFISIDVGDLGRNSDGGVFRSSRLGRLLDAKRLNLPEPQPLPNDNSGTQFPYYFCADEAFPLKLYLMRPYPRRTLTNSSRIFNCRLSVGRKSVECAFGMMASKFAVFQTPIACSEKKVVSVVKCACVLHNYVRKTEGKMYDVHRQVQEDIATTGIDVQMVNEQLNSANAVRDYLRDYFLTPAAAIPSQWKYAVA